MMPYSVLFYPTLTVMINSYTANKYSMHFIDLLYRNHKQRKGYSKTCVKRPLSKRPKIDFQDKLSLNAGQSIAECSKRSILQYVRPSLSYHSSFSHLSFVGFLIDRFTQVYYTLKENALSSLVQSNVSSSLSTALYSLSAITLISSMESPILLMVKDFSSIASFVRSSGNSV